MAIDTISSGCNIASNGKLLISVTGTDCQQKRNALFNKITEKSAEVDKVGKVPKIYEGSIIPGI